MYDLNVIHFLLKDTARPLTPGSLASFLHLELAQAQLAQLRAHVLRHARPWPGTPIRCS